MGTEVILRVPEEIWRKECTRVNGLLGYIARNGAYRAACKRLSSPIEGTAPLGYVFLRDKKGIYVGHVREVRRGPGTPPGIYYATIDAVHQWDHLVYPWGHSQDNNRAYLWLQTNVDTQGRPVADLSLTGDLDHDNRVAQDSMLWAWAACGWAKVAALEMDLEPRPTVEAQESAAPENCKACSATDDYDCVAEREQMAPDPAADYIWGVRHGA